MVKIDDADMAGKWERLASRDPLEACRASGAAWDGDRRVYVVDCLTDTLEVDVEARTVDRAGERVSPDDAGPKRDLALLVLEYLANVRDVPVAGRWISGKELPSWAFFWRGPHQTPADMLARRFGNSPQEFLEKAACLGGVRLEEPDIPGDAAVRFRVFPRIDVLVVLWAADDEFPARATLLFDASISEHLMVDGVFALALMLALRLMRA